MSAAPRLNSTIESKWTIVNGPMTGAVRLINLAQFVIGRSAECEFIIVDDPKCSRKHAAVRYTPNGYEITSLNETNLVRINGKDVQQSLITDSDLITVGDTDLLFNLTVPIAQRPPRETGLVRTTLTSSGGAGPSAVPAARPMQEAPVRTGASRPLRSSSRAKKSNNTRFIIYAVIVLLGYWLFSGSALKKQEVALRTEKTIQADIETANKLKEAADSQARALPITVTSRQAQEHYVRGFRDYQKGQYERGLESFQACLALSPDHVLCNRYIKLAQRKFNELVQYQIVLGRKYRDQNQFRACRAAFRNVMVMVKDVSSPAYKEAKANYEACHALVEGRF